MMAGGGSAADRGEGRMSNEAGRLVFSRDPSGTFIDGMVFGTSGGGENTNLEVLCALPYELVRPHASASVLGPLVGVGDVKRLSLSVKYLDGEISVGRHDRVSGFLVEQARALVGGDAEYQLSAVVCRPGVAERLDLRSDAFTPMLLDDRDPFDDGCMLGESLSYLCGMDPARPGAVYERLGYAKGWLDEGRAYQTVLSPYAYVRRPDRSIIVSDDCWNALIEVFDVPDEQALDCLCLGVRCGGAWPIDGGEGGAMARSVHHVSPLSNGWHPSRCREGVAEQLDLSSDAFAPMIGSDGIAVSFSYQPCDRLRCVCSTNPAKGFGVFHVWTELGAAYQAVLGPCAYERRPEKTLTLPDELWSRNESWMRDFFEQETSDFLCLGVVSRRTNIRFVGGGGAMV